MTERDLLRDLRALGDVRAPRRLSPAVLERLELAGEMYATLETALGSVYVAFNRTGVSAVMHAESAQAFEASFRRRFGRGVRPAASLPRTVNRFDLRGLSEFEQAVLHKALEIPRGEVRTYAWVAREIGRPAAVRAVGSALAKNPVPVLIPCHRVVRSDGRIGEYALGGPQAKRTILAAEGVPADELESLARGGVRYVGSDTTRIYCFPTCRHARRVMQRHLVRFRSETDAAARGYRPCKVCRPSPPPERLAVS